MNQGKAPQVKAKVLIRKTGQVVTKDVSIELHHATIPQRVGGAGVYNKSNLQALTPWDHEAIDPYRNTGEKLIKIIDDIGSWK